MQLRRFHATAAALALVAFGAVGAGTALAANAGHGTAASHDHHNSDTATPIKHLVVIFDENVSFDHYFGTYPFAANLPAFNVVAGQTYGALCGPASATINDTPCTNPPGLNATDPTSSNITTSASGPTSVAKFIESSTGTCQPWATARPTPRRARST